MASLRFSQLPVGSTPNFRHFDVVFSCIFEFTFSLSGIHPYSVPSVDELESSIAELNELIESSPHCRAVGECGLDFSEGFPPAERQLAFFEAQVGLALKHKKPLFLHERQASTNFISILQRHGLDQRLGQLVCPVVVHCFTGSVSELKEYIEMGFSIGITGYIFRDGDEGVAALRKALEQGVAPLDKIMIETDAP